MGIYAKNANETKKRKPKSKKTVETVPEPVPEPVEEVKKPRSEKQLAASARAVENRKRKREEKVASDEKAEKAKVEKEAAVVAKKEAIKEKRRLKRLEKKDLKLDGACFKVKTPPTPEATEEEGSEGPAPVWVKEQVLKKHKIDNENRETKISKRAINHAASEDSKKIWKNDAVREKIVKHNETHEQRMRRMMFGK